MPVGQPCPRCSPEQQRKRRHKGYDDAAYRRVRRSKQGKLCEKCGRMPGRILHHKDGDPSNNARSNLVWLCGPDATDEDEAMRLRRDGPKRPRRSPWR